MNVVQNAAIIADAPKAAMQGNVGKKNSSIGNEKDKPSFSDVLNAASGSSSGSDNPIDDRSNTQIIEEPVQQQYLTMLMPLFQLNTANTAVSANLISDKPKSGDNQPISALAGAAGLDMVSATAIASNVATTEVSLPTGSVIDQKPNVTTVTTTTNELNSAEMVLQQPSKTSNVIENAGTQANPVVDSKGDLISPKTEGILLNNTDNVEQPQKASELASKLSVKQPSSAVLLKPLEAAAGFQQAAMSPENRPVVDPKAADAAPKVAHTQQQNISSASVLPDAQQGGQGNVATDKKALTDELATVGDNKAEGTQASFSNVLHQVSKDNQVASSDAVSQPSAQTVQDSHEVVSQIVEHARLVKAPNASEMIIKLKPEHLGELTLKVAVDNGVVSATFHSANSEVRSIIEASIQQLKQDMAQQGLKVDNVGVYAGMGQLLSDGQGETYKKQEWKPSTKKDNKDDFNETLNVVEAASVIASDSGVDYRI